MGVYGLLHKCAKFHFLAMSMTLLKLHLNSKLEIIKSLITGKRLIIVKQMEIWVL